MLEDSTTPHYAVGVTSDSLLKQLEMTRFERAMEVAESLADHRALLTTVEIARMNSILTGSKNPPWRENTATITLPTGKQHTLSLHSDPVINTRDLLHRCTETAENGAYVDAAIDVYIGLVMSHAFEDANRRTAVLAAHYFFRRYGVPLSGLAIHEMGLGDLREPEQVQTLRETIHQMARFANSRGARPITGRPILLKDSQNDSDSE